MSVVAFTSAATRAGLTSPRGATPTRARSLDRRGHRAKPPIPTSRDRGRRRSVVAEGKKGLFDEMLDVMEGGPKLRKWYGQDSSVGAPGEERVGDGGVSAVAEPTPDEEEELREWDKKPRRGTLVAGAETALGEAIIMQLIVAKQPVVALGISPDTAASRYGPYVVAVEDPASAANALRRGCRAVICCGDSGVVPAAVVADGKVKHAVLVSSAANGGGGLLGGIFGGDDGRRVDPAREDAFRAIAGAAPVTIARPARIRAGMGGKPIVFGQKGKGKSAGAGGGDVSLEDAAEVCVRCLGAPPKPGEVLEFDFANGPGAAGAKRDWKGLFGSLDAN